MIVEVIAVGTELLLGQIVNTNAATIGAGLAEDGFDVHFQVMVGDNIDRLDSTIRSAIARADAVVLTGGIGPTQDDQTRDAICRVLGTETIRDEAHARKISDRLAARGVVADTALRMADYPKGSTPLPNSKGVALGIFAVFDNTPVFAVPGVPTEMRAMIDDEVRPRLRAASGEPSILVNRQLHCWGLGESQIAERLDHLYASVNPSVAFLINGPEVRVRITAKAATRDEAESMIEVVERTVRSQLGDVVFAVDDEKIDGLLADLLGDREWTIAAVEVLTVGLLSARLAGVGSFVGSTIVAEGRSAESISDIEDAALDLLHRHDGTADVVISVSGATGQAVGDGSAARKLAVGIRTPDTTTVRILDVLGDDERARQFAVPGALHVLRQTLTNAPSLSNPL